MLGFGRIFHNRKVNYYLINREQEGLGAIAEYLVIVNNMRSRLCPCRGTA